MIFKDWRLCDQSLVPLELDKTRFYYIQAQAWAMKGYLGGTHSYSTFWSNQHSQWLVVELTDQETVEYQNCDVLFKGVVTKDKTIHAPFITNRAYNARWFGHAPSVVDSCPLTVEYDDIVSICSRYPIEEFVLYKRNCNTFTSYLLWQLNLPLRRPIRSIGFRSPQWWLRNS